MNRAARPARASARPLWALQTPEGVALSFAIPPGGERVAAFVIDILLMVAIFVVLTILLLVTGIAAQGSALGGGSVLLVLWVLGGFFLRFFWFTLFECGARGATPGKRRQGIRVASRSGGPLTPAMIVARNMLREIEIFLPIAMLSYRASQGLADTAMAFAGIGWTGVFLLFPLFNKQRLRIGDVIAGTIVVQVPRPVLAPDLAADLAIGAGPAGTAQFSFTDAQLDVYGIYELQRLETVLRGARPQIPGRPRKDDDPVVIVGKAVRAKLGLPSAGDDLALLQAYYAALKARLERSVVMGRRKVDKFDGA
ncbi:RDD family protein [Sandarakinorhabdus sp.]|uniref:RDD family protein n=1 Tax=Sandarakinorhabdus sp. TaxID=1916663 RepID=UPI00286D9FAB|nr:RDD family protein [Sandarakinorhabdus sp.]